MVREELQKKIDRSIKLLQSIKPKDDQPIELAYSGGKDSDVILQLAKEAGINYKAIYKNTTIDPLGTKQYAISKGVEFRNARMGFFEMVRKKGYPTRMGRFCCEMLKEYKILDKCIIGVRKEESKARDKRYQEPTKCLFLGNKKEHVEAIYPILEWTSQDVKDFIEDRDIKCHPLYYDELGNFHVERRLGCVGCPLTSKQKRIEEFKKQPKMVVAWINAGKKYLETHPNCQAIKHYGDVYTMFYSNLYSKSYQQIDDENGFFGKPDYKHFLEQLFNIQL